MRSAYLFALPIVSGLSIGAALTNQWAAVLIFVGLVPLLVFIDISRSKKRIFLGGWLYGVILWAILVKWILDFLPLDWAGFSTGSAVFFVTFSWGLTALVLGITPAIFALVAKSILKKNMFLLIPLGIPVWVAMEFLSSWFPTVLWIGMETRVLPITLGHIGYALANFPGPLQLASWGSVYVLSAGALLINICVFFPAKYLVLPVYFPANRDQHHSIQKDAPILGASLLILSGFLLFSFYTMPAQQPTTSGVGRPMRIALVSSNIPSWSAATAYEKEKIKENLGVFVNNLSKERLDLILFPENSEVMNQISADELALWFGNQDTVLIDNAVVKSSRYNKDPLVSRLIAQNLRTKEVVALWNKSFLMMAGEYPPVILSLWAKAFGLSDILERYKKVAYQPGETEEAPIRIADNHSAAVSICTQGWAPQFFWKQKKLGADFLINMSADALFHGSKIYEQERVTMLKARAVENRAYLLHATNANPSFLIDPAGAVTYVVKTPEYLQYSYKIVTLTL